MVYIDWYKFVVVQRLRHIIYHLLSCDPNCTESFTVRAFHLRETNFHYHSTCYYFVYDIRLFSVIPSFVKSNIVYQCAVTLITKYLSRKGIDYHNYNHSIKVPTLKEGHNMWPYIQFNSEVAIL